MGEHITSSFLNIDDILLTKRLDRNSYQEAVSNIEVDQAKADERHLLTFYFCEVGRLTFDEYLDRVDFYRGRNFSKLSFVIHFLLPKRCYHTVRIIIT